MNHKKDDLVIKLIDAVKKCSLNEVYELASDKASMGTDQLGFSAVHHCAITGNIDIFNVLVKAGFNLKSKTKTKKTLLHIACQFGHFDILKILFKNKLETAINDKDMLGMTSLHWAVERNHTQLVEFLCQNLKLNFDEVDIYGRKPIDIALSNKNDEIVSILQKFINENQTCQTRNCRITSDLPKYSIKSFSKCLSKSYSTVYVASDTEESENETQSSSHSPPKMNIDDHLRWLQSEKTTNSLLDDIATGGRLVLTEAGRRALELTDERESSNNFMKKITKSFENQYEEDDQDQEEDEEQEIYVKKFRFSS